MKIINKIKFLNIHEFWFIDDKSEFKNCLFEFKIFKNTKLNINNFYCYKDKKFTLIIDLLKNKDDIFKSFKSNLKNEIRKVDKLDNIIIEFNNINQSTFIEFYNQFAQSKKLDLLTKRRLKKYQDNLIYVSAKLDNELTNVQVYIVDEMNQIIRLLYSISTIHGLEDKIKRNQIGWINKSLHWKSIVYFREKGFKIFDWGGYENDENNKDLAGIDKFKQSFGGKLIEVYDYYSFPIYILIKLQALYKRYF